MQSIMYFRDPFRLVPINNIADIADKFTRNEILSSNEIRQIIGMKPSNDPRADKLINSNLNHPGEEEHQYQDPGIMQEEYDTEDNNTEDSGSDILNVKVSDLMDRKGEIQNG